LGSSSGNHQRLLSYASTESLNYIGDSVSAGVLNPSTSSPSFILGRLQNLQAEALSANDIGEFLFSQDSSFPFTCSLGESSHWEKVLQELKPLMVDNGYETAFSSLETCSETSFWVACCDCGHRWEVERTCDLRICPRCESSRKSRVIRKYKEEVLDKMNPGHIRFITLTKENVQNLHRSDIRELRNDFNKLRRKQLFPDKEGSKSVFGSKMWGGIYAIEINHTSNGWNLHMHILYEGYYIDQENLSRAWEEITGSPVVDIRKSMNSEKNVLDLCKYVAKKPFVSKNSENISPKKNASLLFEYFEATYKTNLIQVFGKFHHNHANTPNITIRLPSVVCPKCGSQDIVNEFQVPEIVPDSDDPPPSGQNKDSSLEEYSEHSIKKLIREGVIYDQTKSYL